jgi:ADP-heptose:LPS heptosyltransferase
MLAARGARVYLEVKENVYRLLQNLEGAERVIARGEDLPEFDWQCPLMSLPMGFKTDLTSIPANVPYLKAPEDAVKLWAERLDRFHVQDRFRVGIVWSGNPKHSRERYRAVPLERLAQLSRINGTAFYSLQKGPGASQVDALGADLAVVNLDEQQSDFTDTAAIVANLDLVITIDTSVAHLAGGMGKPVWILLHSAPDWRWMRERDDSPWYPTARLFRQTKAGNWDDVLEKVRRDLTALVAAHRASISDLALRGAIA